MARSEGESAMNIHSIDWNAVPWEQVREGVERKAFSGDGATVSLNRLQPGHEPRPHDHPHEQIVYILAGEIDFHIGETGTRPPIRPSGSLTPWPAKWTSISARPPPAWARAASW